MANRLEKIFNECIERINNGESPQSCLSRYPHEAADLEPMIATYLNVRWRASNIEPRPEFKAEARQQLFSLQTTQRLIKDIKPSKQTHLIFSVQRVWVPAVAAIIAVLMIGGGTVAAAAFSLPDQPLYPVKLATDNVRLALAFSDTDKAILNVQMAQSRSAEIIAMAQKGKTDLIMSTTDRMIKNLEDAEIAINNVAQSESAGVVVAILSSPTIMTSLPQVKPSVPNQPTISATQTPATSSVPSTPVPDDKNGGNLISNPNPDKTDKTPQNTPPATLATTPNPNPPATGVIQTPVTQSVPVTSGSDGKNGVSITGNPNPDKTPQNTPSPTQSITANVLGGNNGNQGSTGQITAQTSASKSEKLIQDVQPILNNTLTKLQDSLVNSPVSVRIALQQAIDASKAKQENIRNITNSVNSSQSSSAAKQDQNNNGNSNSDKGNSGNSQSSSTNTKITATTNTTATSNTTATNNSVGNNSNHSASDIKNDHSDK